MSQRRTIMCFIGFSLFAVIAAGLVFRGWRLDDNSDRSETGIVFTADEGSTILDGFSEEDRAKIEATFEEAYDKFGRDCVVLPVLVFQHGHTKNKVLEDVRIMVYPLGKATNQRLD